MKLLKVVFTRMSAVLRSKDLLATVFLIIFGQYGLCKNFNSCPEDREYLELQDLHFKLHSAALGFFFPPKVISN